MHGVRMTIGRTAGALWGGLVWDCRMLCKGVRAIGAVMCGLLATAGRLSQGGV